MRPVDSSSTAATQYQPVQYKPPPPPPPPAPKKHEEKSFLSKMKDGFDGAVDKGKQLVDKAEDKLVELKDKAGEFVDDWKENLDSDKQIDKLGKGDKYTLSLGGDLSVEGVKASAKGTIEVSVNNDGKYVVTADAELGAGLYGQLGASVVANASVDAEAMLGVGGKVEMKFDSPEEAKRATDTLVRLSSPAVATLKGGAPSKEDMNLLTGNLSAIELKGNGAVELSGKLGVGVQNAANLGLSAKGELKSELSLRIEFGKDKKPSVSIKQEISGQFDAGAQAVAGNVKGVALQGTIKGSVQIETKLSVPDDLDTAALLKDPMGTLPQTELKAVETISTVTAQAEGQIGTRKDGIEGKLVIKNSGAKMLESGAMADALRGDYAKALEEAAGAEQVEVSVTQYDKHGVSASAQLKAFGFGGTLDIASRRTDKADSPMMSYKGSAKEAGAALLGWNDQQQQAAALNQQVTAGRYSMARKL
jgi:hypothetical protein